VRISVQVAAIILAAVTPGGFAAHAANSEVAAFSEGNFFVGPEPFPMYVEYFLPAKATHKIPIVLVHGCCTTGAGFVTTPDGREGWAKYFVEKGWKTYVVDHPGQGRSPMPENYPTMSLQRAVDDSVVLLKKIGPAIFIVHSIGGMIGWKLCDTVPDQVAAMIGVAPVPPANMPKGRDTLRVNPSCAEAHVRVVLVKSNDLWFVNGRRQSEPPEWRDFKTGVDRGGLRMWDASSKP